MRWLFAIGVVGGCGAPAPAQEPAVEPVEGGEPASVVERFVAPPMAEAEDWPAVPFPCELAPVMAARLDPASRDCGVVPSLLSLLIPGRGETPQTRQVKAELSAVRNCVLDSLRTAAPFHVTFDVWGIDSTVGEGVIGHRVGDRLVVEHLEYDSDPCGGSCPEKGASWSRRCGVVTFGACDDPSSDFCMACDERTPLHVCEKQ